MEFLFLNNNDFLVRPAHSMWDVDLIVTNRLSGFRCPKIERDKKLHRILTISDAKKIKT